MAKIGTEIYVWLFCDLVGKDHFGNRYYVDKRLDFEGKHKRMVIYNGRSDASKIPPLWHSWMHYIISEIPNKKPTEYSWQKKYQPNLTGTSKSYFPSERDKTIKSWNPIQKKS